VTNEPFLVGGITLAGGGVSRAEENEGRAVVGEGITDGPEWPAGPALDAALVRKSTGGGGRWRKGDSTPRERDTEEA
jgi:hypothetical protein